MTKRSLAAAAATLAAASAIAQVAPPPAFDAAVAKQRVDALLDKNYPHLDAVYKDIHAHPEVAFLETRTAGVLAAEMRKLGFQVTEHVGKTGIVALYKNGDGPTVLVRTELDALPMEEKTACPMRAAPSRTSRAGRPMWPTVVVTIPTWPGGWVLRKPWWR